MLISKLLCSEIYVNNTGICKGDGGGGKCVRMQYALGLKTQQLFEKRTKTRKGPREYIKIERGKLVRLKPEQNIMYSLFTQWFLSFFLSFFLPFFLSFFLFLIQSVLTCKNRECGKSN